MQNPAGTVDGAVRIDEFERSRLWVHIYCYLVQIAWVHSVLLVIINLVRMYLLVWWIHPTFRNRGTAYNSRSFTGNLLFVGDYGS
jgi:hypothetical protein